MTLEVKYYNHILKCSRYFDKVNFQDLAQNVCVRLIENRLKALEVEDSGKIEAYIFIIAKNEYLAERTNQSTIDLDSVQVIYEVEIDYKKELEDLIIEKKLPFIDRLWVEAFLSRDLNASWLQSDLGIGRHCAKRRLKHVIDKLK